MEHHSTTTSKDIPQLAQASAVRSASWRDYLALCKPRVVALMLITSYVGMILGVSHLADLSWACFFYGGVGIALAASAGGTMNQLIDRRIDAIMARTLKRPLPAQLISTKAAAWQAAIMSLLSVLLLSWQVNWQCAALTMATLLGYGVVYSVYLKRATPQNIVIGGLAGAMPPMLGWAAATGHILGYGWILVLIIYLWTPPHFWSLAIHRRNDYAKAIIPMLPLTHGVRFTKINIIFYTVLMVLSSYLPCVVHLSGWVYFIAASLLNILFVYYVLALCLHKQTRYALACFHYSISYLGILFLFMLLDHLFFWGM